ncbi:MAG TPA: hypothetical protein VMY37_06380 [Thermoguttaceae bacterium]|nr:hypothetical protein [Thermoguttaceae bacterium]
MQWSRFRTGLFLTLLALALALLVLPAAAPTASAAEPPGLQKAMQAQERHTARLMALPDVVGTAVGLDAQGQPAVKVLTARGGVAGIPANLEGVPVEVEVTGLFFAIPGRPAGKKPPPLPAVDPTSRFDDPVPIGVSTGNEFSWSAGTIGCKVFAIVEETVECYALSNVHVFDPWHYGVSSEGNPNAVERGERMVQPGRIDDPADDGGVATEDNILGKIVGSVPIDFSGEATNYVDAAIAIVPTADYEGVGDCRTLGNSTPIDGYGTPEWADWEHTVCADVGQAVQKYGRSTGLTKGEVSLVNVTVEVGYDVGTAVFVGQILIDGRKFLKPGDSGSLVVTDPGKSPVGLLFAGNTRGSLGIANPIGLVLAAFQVSIDGTPPAGE